MAARQYSAGWQKMPSHIAPPAPKPRGRYNWAAGRVEAIPPPEVAPITETAPGGQRYRREPVSAPDADGFRWIIPSASVWPDVKGNPPGPRTQMIGYNIAERKVRTVFRDGTPWQYSDVSPDEWERVRRTASTGKLINRMLNNHPYGREEFTPPAPVVFYPR